jgi:hypothetical protein
MKPKLMYEQSSLAMVESTGHSPIGRVSVQCGKYASHIFPIHFIITKQRYHDNISFVIPIDH